jgi:hypothetical protein
VERRPSFRSERYELENISPASSSVQNKDPAPIGGRLKSIDFHFEIKLNFKFGFEGTPKNVAFIRIKN